jgi:hypothetical protein
MTRQFLKKNTGLKSSTAEEEEDAYRQRVLVCHRKALS